jgi:hypothetical protein
MTIIVRREGRAGSWEPHPESARSAVPAIRGHLSVFQTVSCSAFHILRSAFSIPPLVTHGRFRSFAGALQRSAAVVHGRLKSPTVGYGRQLFLHGNGRPFAVGCSPVSKCQPCTTESHGKVRKGTERYGNQFFFDFKMSACQRPSFSPDVVTMQLCKWLSESQRFSVSEFLLSTFCFLLCPRHT